MYKRQGDLLGFMTRGSSTPTLTISGSVHTIGNVQASSMTVETNRNGVVWLSYETGTSRWTQLNDPTKLSTATTAGIIEIASNAEATAGSATDRALVPSNLGSVGTSQLNNDAGFITSATDTTKLAILNNLSDLDNAGTARTNLGLVIGTNVQAYDLGLTSIASLTTAADKMLYTDGSDSYAVTGLTSAGRALLDDADASAQRTTLGLVIGTDVAPIAAPAFTGNATAVTQSQSDGSTKIATTAYVDTAVAGAGGGGGGYTYSAITANPSPAVISYHYSCGAGNQTFTITLPSASGATAGKSIRVKNMGTGTITLDPGSDTIDGSSTDYAITTQYASITLVSNGSNAWEII